MTPSPSAPEPVSAAVVTGAGSALPATIEQDAVWEGYFARHYEGVRAARRIFAGAGVRRRHAVASPLDEDLSNWGTGARMERYVQEALPLGKQAVAGALDAAGLAPGDVGLFAVATCTGYATPGLDIRLASDLGMPPGLQRLLVGHMGCYAAIPGLAAVSDFVDGAVPPGGAAVLRADQPARPAGAGRPRAGGRARAVLRRRGGRRPRARGLPRDGGWPGSWRAPTRRPPTT